MSVLSGVKLLKQLRPKGSAQGFTIQYSYILHYTRQNSYSYAAFVTRLHENPVRTDN